MKYGQIQRDRLDVMFKSKNEMINRIQNLRSSNSTKMQLEAMDRIRTRSKMNSNDEQMPSDAMDRYGSSKLTQVRIV